MAPSFASQSTLICADDRSVPIFVVSLAKDNSRRAPFAAKMQELGLNFTFVDAVDGRQSLPSIYVHEVDRHSAKKRLHRDISDGELACSLSHIHLYKTVMDREDIAPPYAYNAYKAVRKTEVLEEKVCQNSVGKTGWFQHGYGH